MGSKVSFIRKQPGALSAEDPIKIPSARSPPSLRAPDVQGLV